MKKLVGMLLGVCVAATLFGCSKEENDQNSGAIALVPTAQSCFGAGNQGGWNQYGNWGYQPYPPMAGYGSYTGSYVGAYNNGFCGCRPGEQAVCHPTMGMACVPVSNYMGANMVNWYWDPRGGAFSRQSWNSYGAANSCGYNIGQACRVGMNDCGFGHCFATSYSPIGVCVQ